MKSILDPQFQYIPAVATDIKATFERIRKEQQEQAPAVFTSNRQKEQQHGQSFPISSGNS